MSVFLGDCDVRVYRNLIDEVTTGILFHAYDNDRVVVEELYVNSTKV